MKISLAGYIACLEEVTYLGFWYPERIIAMTASNRNYECKKNKFRS